MAKRKPINTGYIDTSFFDMDDVNLNVEWGRDYLETDIPATIMLHSVDVKKSKVHSLYGESRASEKITLPPVELKVRFSVEDSESNFIQGTNINRHYAGDLIFTVYDKELDEKKVKIKRGDFVSLKNSKGDLAYYEVNDPDLMNVSNSKTIGGLTSFYKTIKCKVVDKDVFNG